VADATGARVLELPLTPERVLEALISISSPRQSS
jgi:CO/xanthine dehydrogenase Mo-binding subunit